MRDRGRKVWQGAKGAWSCWFQYGACYFGVISRAVLREDVATVVNIDDTRGRADSDVPVHPGCNGPVRTGACLLVLRFSSAVIILDGVISTTDPAEGKNRNANSTFVQPADNRLPPLDIPLCHFAILACDAHARTVAPPAEISNATTALNADLLRPLQSLRVQNIYGSAATFASGTEEREMLA